MYRLIDIECGGAHPVRCFGPSDLVLHRGDACIFQQDDIKEFGRVFELKEIADEPDASVGRMPVVLRRATLQDQSQANENILFLKSVRRLCDQKIKEYELLMNPVRIRFSLDRSRLIVDFTADERVDFRRLVQALAAETRARVDMRQIGVRDAASLVGGIAPCGRRLCCSEWLKEFENVNVRMAKAQGVSLGPAAINGMCGRLKCCLRFEYNCYRDLSRKMPRDGIRVRCPDGVGKVVSSHVLVQRVKVLLDDSRLLVYDVQDIKTLGNS